MATAPIETQTQQPVQRAEIVLNPDNPRERQIMLVEREFSFMQRRARLFSESDIVPERYRGNMANCAIAMEIAQRMETGIIQIMQSLYVVHGMPAFEAKYMIALINSSNVLTGRLKFIFSGGDDKNADSYGCHAEGIEAATGEILRGPKVDMAMVKAEGWLKNSKWTSLRDLMFTYRAAAFWCRTNTPELLLGMKTVDEAEDITERDITGSVVNIGSVQEMLDQIKKPALKNDGASRIEGGAVIDNDSGEVSQQQSTAIAEEKPEVKQPVKSKAPVISYTDAANALSTSNTLDELNEAMDLARGVANPVHRQQLEQIFDKRSAELQ